MHEQISRAWPAARAVLASKMAGSFLVPRTARPAVLRAAGIAIGADVDIVDGVLFEGRPVVIGDGSFINRGCTIGTRTVIGARVAIGPGVRIITDTHDLGPTERRAGPHRWEAVHIGDGCWIGANATILPGVSVAPGCVVAAGAVVTTGTSPDGLYAGVPARRVRDLG